MKNIILIGYSGHAFVAADIFQLRGIVLLGYCERQESKNNPFQINYLGIETNTSVIDIIKSNYFFPSIGDNYVRERVYKFLTEHEAKAANAIHPDTSISAKAELGEAVLIAAGVRVNALATIGNGVIINTSAVIDHESALGNFVHIAPGAVITGQVTIGDRTFIGANAVVRNNIKIGSDVIIGAGAVVVEDIPDGGIYVGNPAKIMNK